MTICIDEAVAHSDETYWADNNAAEPVLLIDEATEAITEAVHQIRSGSRLDDRDVSAAGAVLGDLFGGLGQLADLLTTLVDECSDTDQLHVARLEILRATTLSAHHAAEGLRLGSADNPSPISDHQMLGLLQGCVSELVYRSHGAQDTPVPGVFEEGHQGDGGNPVGSP